MKPYELFEILAGTTWRSIEGFGRRRIQLGEDAITSNHLYALDSAGSDCWSIEDTRSQESTRGCDFEFGSAAIKSDGGAMRCKQRK